MDLPAARVTQLAMARFCVRAMLDADWLVLAGERFRIATSPGIRVTTSTLAPSDAAGLARLIAAAEHAGRPRRVY